jgi:hypothetical protein
VVRVTTRSWECVVPNRTVSLSTFWNSVLCPSSGDWRRLFRIVEGELVLFRTVHSQERVVPHGVTAINAYHSSPTMKIFKSYFHYDGVNTDSALLQQKIFDISGTSAGVTWRMLDNFKLRGHCLVLIIWPFAISGSRKGWNILGFIVHFFVSFW